nr:unnamed protein product [Spirometra erinaceieuropaei]
MDDEMLPKRLFCGDAVAGSRRQGGQVRRYNDTLKTSLKHLQINPVNWTDFVRDQPTSSKTMETGAAMFEANRITVAKAKRETYKSQLSPPPFPNANARPTPTCPPCQRTFRAPIGLVGHLRTNFSTRTAPTVVPPSTSPLPPAPSANVDRPRQPPLPPSSSSSSSNATTSMSAAVASAMPINTTHNPDTPTNTNIITVNSGDEDPVYA